MESDREKVMAWILYDKSLCPCGCGRPAEESMAKENQRAYDAEMVRCHARAAMVRKDLEVDRGLRDDPNAESIKAGLLVQLSRYPEG